MKRATPVLSLCWLTVRGAHPLDHVEAAVAGGFNAVGLRLVPPTPGDAMVPVVGDAPLVRELLARLAATSTTVLDVETVWIGPDFDLAPLLPMLDLAQRLGCRNLLTMGHDADPARLTTHFAALCDAAARFGIDVSIEFCAYTQVSTLAAAQRLVVAAARPNARILVDMLHLARSGGTPQQLAALDPALLTYCQLADARGPRPATDAALRDEARGGRYLPGDGELPLADLVAALPAGLALGVEAPCAAFESLTVVERGRLAGQAVRRWLQQLP